MAAVLTNLIYCYWSSLVLHLYYIRKYISTTYEESRKYILIISNKFPHCNYDMSETINQ